MTGNRPFHARPEHYDRNAEDGAAASVGPAIIHTRTGRKERGVVIRIGDAAWRVLHMPDALRLANEIADIATNRNQEDA